MKNLPLLLTQTTGTFSSTVLPPAVTGELPELKANGESWEQPSTNMKITFLEGFGSLPDEQETAADKVAATRKDNIFFICGFKLTKLIVISEQLAKEKIVFSFFWYIFAVPNDGGVAQLVRASDS